MGAAGRHTGGKEAVKYAQRDTRHAVWCKVRERRVAVMLNIDAVRHGAQSWCWRVAFITANATRHGVEGATAC